MKNKAVFLDRDGVINEMVYNPDFGTIDCPLNPKEFKLLPGVAKAVKLINEMGFLAIVISNQPCVSKGKISLKLLEEINKKLERELAKEGACLDGIYYCFHHPDSSQVKVKKYLKKCGCRKPMPGLLLEAAKEMNVVLSKSYMIGDGFTDIQAGKRAGCKTIFLGHLRPSWCIPKEALKVKPHFRAKNLLSAIKLIKKQKI